MIRSTGEHTYFAADCAYIVDKFGRGFDRLLYVLGADHHGTVARLKGAAAALGFDADAMEILLYQWVTFLRDGEPMPMSKRAGTFITLDELIDEVGVDAARFTLLQFSNDSTMNFDIDAVKRQSMDNPVYYVQYGHARIASILRRAERRGGAPQAGRGGGPRRCSRTTRSSTCCGRSRSCPSRSRRPPSSGRRIVLAHAAQELAARVPSLLHGVPRGLRRRGAHPGPAVAGEGAKQVDRDPAVVAGRLGAGVHGTGRWLSRSTPRDSRAR